jgi:hypothetical protein
MTAAKPKRAARSIADVGAGTILASVAEPAADGARGGRRSLSWARAIKVRVPHCARHPDFDALIPVPESRRPPHFT